MKSHRNSPPTSSSHHGYGLVNDLRDTNITPETYKSYKLVDGKEVFVGEFPTPPISYKAQTQIDIKRS